MKIAYFDCFAGAAGDMVTAAILDAGLDLDLLKARLETLGINGLKLQVSRTTRAGIGALTFKAQAPKQNKHRNLRQITELIKKSRISKQAETFALAVFQKLARAEAAVHNCKPEEVHFHELGAIDSIVDIVSAAIGLNVLKIEKIYCSTLNLGAGSIKIAHGNMPVPAPATAELLKGLPVSGGPIQAELLTPTAAAILATAVDSFGHLPPMKIDAVGYGAGSLNPSDFPNVLRLFLGLSLEEKNTTADTVALLQTNIDDISPEIIGYLSKRLLQNGALDVYSSPINMKQDRPAICLSVLCKPQDAAELENIIFEEGLTLGIRKQFLQRSKLQREFVTVETQFGRIRIKKGSLNGKTVTAKPEFSDCAAAAEKADVPVKKVIEAATHAYRNFPKKTNNPLNP